MSRKTLFVLYPHTPPWHRSTEDAQTIFRDAAAHNMTEAGHVWIVTEQALNANNTPDGVLGLQLKFANDEMDHIRVSVFPPLGGSGRFFRLPLQLLQCVIYGKPDQIAASYVTSLLLSG